jgi:capsular exopolysaccharide synthesis family protein
MVMDSVREEANVPGRIDPGAVIGTIRRRLLPMLAAAALVLILTAIAYSMVEPRFSATARVALDRRPEELVAPATTGSEQPGLTADSASVDTEVQVLRSPEVAGAVVDQLHLEQRQGFGVDEGAAPASAEVRRSRAIRRLSAQLAVRREGTSYAIAVSFASPDPQLATAIVNAVVDQYVGRQRGQKSAQRTRQIAELEARANELGDQLNALSRQAANFRAETDLVDVEKDSTAAQQLISVLNGQLSAARADEAAANASAANARGAAGANSTQVLGSDVIQALTTQRATLSAQRAELQQRYGALHPNLQGVDKQLGAIDRQISVETGRLQASAQAEARIARQRAASLQGSLDRAQNQLLRGNTASVTLDDINRRAASTQSIYQGVLGRLQQETAAQGTETARSYVISRALVPATPDSPNKLLFVLGGLVAALIAAAMTALILELMERGVRSRAETERVLGVPVVASVPDLATVKGSGFRGGTALGAADYLLAHDGSVFNEAFRSIRSTLRVGQRGQTVKTLAITSSLPDEGKTTTAICLARSAALAGHKVVLVDCDLRRRASSRALVDGTSVGLTEVLKGRASLDDALTIDAASGAALLPQSQSGEPDFDAVFSTEMETLLATLRERYDLVVLDTAPVLPVAESRALAAMADATLLIVRWRKTPSQAARMALDQLERAGARVIGGVLSQVDVRRRAGLGSEAVYYEAYGRPARA